MNLPDAIERLRAIHVVTLRWAPISAKETLDAQALAVCIEALEAKRAPVSSDKSAPRVEPWDGGNGK